MFKSLVAILIALILAACGDHTASTDPLVGTWGLKSGDHVRPILKIDREDGSYVAYHYSKQGNWDRLQESINPLKADDLAKITGRNDGGSIVGIQGKSFVFFHEPIGWSARGFTTQTGYVIFVPIRLVDLQRVSS